MTERVTIEGSGLTVTTDELDREQLVPNLDPKRRRPKPYTEPPKPHTGAHKTIDGLLAGPNPYWTMEAVEEKSDGLTPKQLAHRWRHHRIDR